MVERDGGYVSAGGEIGESDAGWRCIFFSRKSRSFAHIDRFLRNTLGTVVHL